MRSTVAHSRSDLSPSCTSPTRQRWTRVWPPTPGRRTLPTISSSPRPGPGCSSRSSTARQASWRAPEALPATPRRPPGSPWPHLLAAGVDPGPGRSTTTGTGNPCRRRRVVRRMKYPFLLYGPDRPFPQPGTSQFREMRDAWNAATEAMAKAGVLIDCAPLQPASASTTVQVRDGQTLLTDGPAAEIKEQFGGYTLVECADLDEALKWAATLPAASDRAVEVRPVITVEAPR